MNQIKKEHWEQVYNSHNPDQVSWTQPIPQTSLDFIHSFHLPKTSKIIDIGGGDSRLVDCLLKEGFKNITVLDISAAALKKAQKRLGPDSKLVKWVVADVNDFKPAEKYDLWHDRATFHFLTAKNEVSSYLGVAGKAVKKYLVIGTFSENGPEKCSGLPVKQYTEEQLQNQLTEDFVKIRCINEDHITPLKLNRIFFFVVSKRNNRQPKQLKFI